nr:hypothetical protein [Tanacetum cinerariifolium]
KSNDESKKQTIGSKRKGRGYKVDDDDDNDGTKRMKKKMDHKEAKHKKNVKISDENKKNIKIRTRTTPTTLFNAMANLNVDRKKCLHEMGFGSMIGMEIHELPGMLDNDDTTGIDKESDSPDCQMESDSPASDDDNQKSDFQVLFHKESGNSYLQSMKNKERNDVDLDSTFVNTSLDNHDNVKKSVTNFEVGDTSHETGLYSATEEDEATKHEDVHHILNEDDKVDDSCPATRVYSIIERDEVKFTEVEDVEKEKQQIGNKDDRVVDDFVTTIPDSVTEGKEDSLNKCDVVIQDENKAIVLDSIERSEHLLEKEKKKISNEELRSQSLKGNTSHATCLYSATEGNEATEHEDVHSILNKDDKVDDSYVGCSIPDLDDAKLDVYNGPDLRSPYEYLPVDVKKPVSDVEKIVANTLFAMIGSKLDLIFESQSGLGLNHLEMETLTLTLMVSAYVFFLVYHEDHIYLICVDFNKGLIHLIDDSANGKDHKNQKYKGIPQAIRKVFVQYLYYVKHPKAEAIKKAKIKRMKMSWRTTRNSTDCGVFTMLHMESYIGAEGEWKCGLAKESKKQNEQLNSLRSKFAAKIILSEFNLLREKFMKLVHAFEQKTKEKRKKTIDDAIANRDHCEKI